MTVIEFLNKIKAGQLISFDETMQVITENYHYRPTQFVNGLPPDQSVNEAGSNEGSCKIFSFARMHHLDQTQTLNLFGDYYRHDVLGNPDGDDHQNIRRFMRYGWDGISFAGHALIGK